MKWSKDKPKIKGWYWYKENIVNEDWTACLIFINPNRTKIDFSDVGVWRPDEINLKKEN